MWHERSRGIDVMPTRGFGGFVMIPMTKVLLLVASLAVFSNATTLDCNDANNPAAPNITISAAGDYDVTCVGSSTWFLFVDGCGNVGSTFVTLRLHSSPKQIILSDIGNPSTSLRGCHVNITYFASTAVPVVGATSARDAHVVVETSSPAGAVVVTVLGTMHLEGKFMAIVGNGTGSIDLVDISFPSGSTIECRSAYPACSSISGTTVLGLGLGCPTIGKVRIVLSGTNTSTSMVPTIASFALINIDNSTGLSTTPTPRDHEIVIDRVGVLWPETSLLVLREFVVLSIFSNPYPFFNGSIIVRGVSVPAARDPISTLFNLDNPRVATLMFKDVESVGGLVSISQGFYQKSVVCGSVQILLDNCDINSTFDSAVVVQLADATPETLDCVLALDAHVHNVTFSPRNHRTLVSVSNPPLLLTPLLLTPLLLTPLLSTVSIKLTVRACKIVLRDTSDQVLFIVVNTTAVNSTIQLIDTMIVQQWTPYAAMNYNFSSRTVYFTEIAPASIIELGSVRNSTVEVTSCNVTVVQMSTTSKFLKSPAALLFSVAGRMTDSLVTITNSSFEVVRNISGGSSFELYAPLLNLSGAGGPLRAAVVMQRSIFINIESIVWGQLIREAAISQNSSLTMTDGCGNEWCPHSESNNGIVVNDGALAVGCTRHLSAVAMVNVSSPLPAWLSIEHCVTRSASHTLWRETATLRLQLTASQTKSIFATSQLSETSLTSASATDVQPATSPLALIAASRGLTAIVTVTYIIPRATSGAALPFTQVSLRSLTLARLCDNSNSDDNDDDPFLSGPMDNPLQLHFSGSSIPSSASFVAGSVVGNIVFCVICSAIGVAVISVSRHRQKQQRILARKEMKAHQSGGATPLSFSNALFECLPYLPSSLVFPYGALSQPLATASAALFVVVGKNDNGAVGGTVGVVILALVGLLICIVLPIHWVAVVRFNWFRKATCPPSSTFDEGENISSVASEIERPAVRFFRRGDVDSARREGAAFLERLLLRLHTFMLFPHAFNGWEPHPQHVSSTARDRYRRPIAVEAYLPLMEAYRPSRQWYFVVDASYSVVCGALSGVAWAVNAKIDFNSASDSQSAAAGDGCEWVTWVTLTLTLLMIFMLGVLRPFLAHYEFGFAFMMAALTAATLALQLAGNEDAADAVVVTQLALGLLMPVVQLLRLVLLWLFVIARDATKAGLSIMDLFVVAVGNGRIRRIPDFVDMLSSSTTPGHNKESGLLHSSTLWPCHDELGSSNSMSCEGRDGDHARRRQLLAEKRLEPLIRLICRSTRMLRKQQDQLRQQRRTKLQE